MLVEEKKLLECLSMNAWEEAVKGTWLPDDELEKITDPAEQYLRGCFKLAYLKGKGRKYICPRGNNE